MDHSFFMPHGVCLLWKPELIALHVITDALVAVSYYSIPAALFWVAARGKETIALKPLLVLFGLFIAFCGGGHALDIIAIWKPIYWTKGLWNLGTALTSVVTALVLIPKVAEYVRMPETTEKLRQQAGELEHRHSVLRAVIDSVQEGIVLVGPDRKSALSNAAADRILGNATGELRVDWTEHAPTEEDVTTLPDGRIVERFTTPVPGHGQLYILRDVTDQRRRESQRLRLERIVRDMRQGFTIVVPHTGEILAANPAFEQMMGYEEGELIGKPVMILNAGDPVNQEETARSIWAAVLRDGFWEGEVRNRRKDGSEFASHARVNLHEEDGKQYLSTIQIDITAQKHLEEEREKLQQTLLHSQKLESLGVLAGGIAHDFNNLLTGIMGNASLAIEMAPENTPLSERLGEIVRASEKASELTRQMLAYAGKGRFLVESIDVSRLVNEIATLVTASVPRNVQIQLDLGRDLPPVDADPTQVQQIVMNLVINGAEAVGKASGVVKVSTVVRDAEAAMAAGGLRVGAELRPGKYVVIDVSDNGSGMDQNTMLQIFDPFFSTKFTGRGLGLAAAQGIVRAHRGAIVVYSEPGFGSRFSVYLPAAIPAAPKPQAATADATPADLSGSGTVLVIDDEEVVRSTAKGTLSNYGYHVLTAENGQTGVDLLRRFAGQVDLVLLDMTMPVMSGEETLRQIRRIRIDMPVILSSGFDQSEAVRRFTKGGIAGFIQKPYTSTALAEAVKTAMKPGPR